MATAADSTPEISMLALATRNAKRAGALYRKGDEGGT
jgi:hypothetical protein